MAATDFQPDIEKLASKSQPQKSHKTTRIFRFYSKSKTVK